jgi:hypothetical protein
MEAIPFREQLQIAAAGTDRASIGSPFKGTGIFAEAA